LKPVLWSGDRQAKDVVAFRLLQTVGLLTGPPAPVGVNQLATSVGYSKDEHGHNKITPSSRALQSFIVQ